MMLPNIFAMAVSFALYLNSFFQAPHAWLASTLQFLRLPLHLTTAVTVFLLLPMYISLDAWWATAQTTAACSRGAEAMCSESGVASWNVARTAGFVAAGLGLNLVGQLLLNGSAIAARTKQQKNQSGYAASNGTLMQRLGHRIVWLESTMLEWLLHHKLDLRILVVLSCAPLIVVSFGL
jgi:hypothetical protein